MNSNHRSTDPDALLTVEQAAALLGFGEQYIVSHSKGRKLPLLPSIRIGNKLRFRRSALLAYVSTHEQGLHEKPRKGKNQNKPAQRAEKE